jgi:hypothetical protein
MHDRDSNSTMRWGNWSETSQVIPQTTLQLVILQDTMCIYINAVQAMLAMKATMLNVLSV